MVFISLSNTLLHTLLKWFPNFFLISSQFSWIKFSNNSYIFVSQADSNFVLTTFLRIFSGRFPLDIKISFNNSLVFFVIISELYISIRFFKFSVNFF